MLTVKVLAVKVLAVTVLAVTVSTALEVVKVSDRMGSVALSDAGFLGGLGC